MGYGFLSDCSNLKSANLNGLVNLESVGDFFMALCTSLESFDATHLKALKTVGNAFLAECSNLKSVNLSGPLFFLYEALKEGKREIEEERQTQ